MGDGLARRRELTAQTNTKGANGLGEAKAQSDTCFRSRASAPRRRLIALMRAPTAFKVASQAADLQVSMDIGEIYSLKLRQACLCSLQRIQHAARSVLCHLSSRSVPLIEIPKNAQRLCAEERGTVQL